MEIREEKTRGSKERVWEESVYVGRKGREEAENRREEGDGEGTRSRKRGRKEGRKDWVVGGGRQEEIREEERVWVERLL